ncbi:hypothetical protein HDU84_000061 [Entophlyctis sp. JEL0112]|nr:hypothetical protein HDU84_000061 [Entophlyctis sp. JEL0112]
MSRAKDWLSAGSSSADPHALSAALPQQQPSPPLSPAQQSPVPLPTPGYNVKRACQPCDRRVPGGSSALTKLFILDRDANGLIEYRLRSLSQVSMHIGACALCDPDTWTFSGSQYDPYLTLLYAERDGCIPSSLVTKFPKFIVPWRYKNRRTGEITWKIFHLSGDKITSADSETIVVNPFKDTKLMNVIKRADPQKNTLVSA